MDYSEELLAKIRDCGEQMLTPKETALYLELDESTLSDEINTSGTLVRRYYLKGVMNTVYSMRQSLFETACAGSPYALSQCKDFILKAATESNL